MRDADATASSSAATLPDLAAFAGALREAGFQGDIGDDEATRLTAATDNSIYQLLPPLVLFPASPSDMRTIARIGAAPGFTDIAFTARGGGTGTNGQALTRAVVVDTSRHLHRILEVDAARRRVRVEPGVVLDQLNHRLAQDGLFFPPHVSTASRATLGGMIGTDACGKGSGRYGRTHDYVESLRVTLADGREMTLRSLTAKGTR
jgi:FAD/FMN-containing dehydrogenase